MSRYATLAFTEPVLAHQRARGSDRAYRRHLDAPDGPPDPLGEHEREFLASLDGFYLASVGPTGWPYVQFRGGPPGFVHPLDEHRFGFADVRGNRQYISTGNLGADDRVALFFMDYPTRTRLKVLGRAAFREPEPGDPLTERLSSPRTDGQVERLVVVTVEGLSWNCHQHITPRYTVEELAPGLDRLRAEITHLRRENDALRARREPGPDGGE